MYAVIHFSKPVMVMICMHACFHTGHWIGMSQTLTCVEVANLLHVGSNLYFFYFYMCISSTDQCTICSERCLFIYNSNFSRQLVNVQIVCLHAQDTSNSFYCKNKIKLMPEKLKSQNSMATGYAELNSH